MLCMSKLPLYQHKNGQWCKRIKGKLYYFGKDLPKALALYEKSRESIAAGYGKITESADYALHELADQYYSHKKQQMESGEITNRHLEDIKETLFRACKEMGRKSVPNQWTRGHFQSLRASLYNGREKSSRSHVTVLGDLRILRSFFLWCEKSKLTESLDYSEALCNPPSRVLRIDRQRIKKGPLGAKEILAILEKCNAKFRPVVLLGINGGMGASDISRLTISQVENAEVLDCPRNKTGAPRRIFLWPETQEAIMYYMLSRKPPKDQCNEQIAFLTLQGRPWVEERKNSAQHMFRRARMEAGLSWGAFYDLRRTFQTIGEEKLDFPAVSFCMGHVAHSSDMAARYRKVSDERIKRVCDHVRSWLFGD